MIDQLTRSQVRENRLKWANFLMRPDTKKGLHQLDNGNGRRCCLGHGAHCFGLEQTTSVSGMVMYCGNVSYAPLELQEILGLWTRTGANPSGKPLVGFGGRSSLAGANDSTDATPQDIGRYLLSVIDGGPDTPFRPLSDYPEAV